MLKTSVFLSALLMSTAAFAQEVAPAPDAAKVDDDKPAVIVTATRTATAFERVAASVTVLDKAAIDRAQDVGVAELLLRTPGVSIARNGGHGTATSLRIRGAESEQTVVVIDGVKINDPSSVGGGYNFGNLLVGDATRIEVLRGPQSTLWGSQAIGGVVNIVTPLAKAPLEGSFDVEAGSRETVSGRAALGGRTGPLAWRLNGQTFTTDGVSAIAPAFGGVERDGYRNRSVGARAMLELTRGLSADVRGYFGDARADLDGFGVDSPEYSLDREFMGYAGINADLLGGRLRNRFAYAYTNTDRENYDPTRAGGQTLTFEAVGRNRRLEYQGSLAIARGWDATFGVEDERSRFRSVSAPFFPGDPAPAPLVGRAGITSFYAQLNASPAAGLTLTGGARSDDHSRYGTRTLFAAGGVWATPFGTVIRASYGEGFKAPSLYQLFSEFGNQSLQPEQAHGWEAGAEQRFFGESIGIGATYFERDTTDQIGFNSCAFPVSSDPLCVTPGTTASRFGYYFNVTRASAHGVEASANARIGARLLLEGNYSWVEAEDRTTGATFGKSLARRPRHTANGSVSYGFGDGGSVGAAVRWSGESFEDAANSMRLAPYTLVDLRGEVPISAAVRLFGRVENLFDESYSTAFRYNSIGRSIFAGFRGRF